MDYQHAMLTEVNAAVVAGDVAVDAAARERIQRFTDRIVDGDESAWDDFTQYLRDHQSVARVVGRHLVGVGYRFLDEELDRLRQIKSERKLNEEERDYALYVLTALINEITKLACKTGTPSTSD